MIIQVVMTQFFPSNSRFHALKYVESRHHAFPFGGPQYVRTKNKVLLDVDTKLATTKSPKTVFYNLIEESGGPMCISLSEIPRNTKQIHNRKYKEKISSQLVNSSPLIEGNIEIRGKYRNSQFSFECNVTL